MRCINTSECFEQMSAYFDGKKTGYFLLVMPLIYRVPGSSPLSRRYKEVDHTQQLQEEVA